MASFNAWIKRVLGSLNYLYFQPKHAQRRAGTRGNHSLSQNILIRISNARARNSKTSVSFDEIFKLKTLKNSKGREDKVEGIVCKWFSDKGYGFVETKSGDEVFFHISQFTNAEEVQRGDRVSFTLIQTKKGPKCVKLQLL